MLGVAYVFGRMTCQFNAFFGTHNILHHFLLSSLLHQFFTAIESRSISLITFPRHRIHAEYKTQVRYKIGKCYKITYSHARYREQHLKIYPSQFPFALSFLQLASTTHQLSTSTADSQFARLLDLSLEQDGVADLPHLCDEGLARQHDACEADLDVLEGTVGLQDVLTGDTKAAQAVENRGRETTDFAELRVDVEGVEVAGETVDSGLLFCCALLDNGVWGALGRGVDLGCCTTVAALLRATKVAGTTDEDRALVVEDFLTSLCILGHAAVYDKTSSALVNNLDQLWYSDEVGFGGNGELADLEVLLSVKKHARVEVGDDLIEGEGRLGVERRNDTKGRDDLEVLVALVDEWEISALRANSKVCHR